MIRRKDKPAQFLACFEGWCKHFRAPPVELYDQSGAHPCRGDRCLIRVAYGWLEWLEANSQGLYHCLQPWDLGIKQHNPLGMEGVTAMQGWRGARPFAAIQIILHGPPEKFIFLEIDFDLSNPGQGALPAALHLFGECIPHKLSAWFGHPMHTNPYRVAKWLRKAGIAVERV